MDESRKGTDVEQAMAVSVPPETRQSYEAPQIEKRERLAEVTGFPSLAPL